MHKCKECGGELRRFVSTANKRHWIDECTNDECNNTVFSAVAKRELFERLRESKEGRTYLWYCGTKRGRCVKSGEKLSICHSCATKQAEKWYRFGKKDERTRSSKLI